MMATHCPYRPEDLKILVSAVQSRPCPPFISATCGRSSALARLACDENVTIWTPVIVLRSSGDLAGSRHPPALPAWSPGSPGQIVATAVAPTSIDRRPSLARWPGPPDADPTA